MMNKDATLWTTTGLFTKLLTAEMFASGQSSVEMIEGVEPSLHITMHEYGDLPVFLSISGDQIIAESILWPLSDVPDPNKLNHLILKTHKLIPLSTIGIDQADDGEEYYYMFGALSSGSSLSDIVFEIEVLAANVIQTAEAYLDFIINSATNEE